LTCEKSAKSGTNAAALVQKTGGARGVVKKSSTSSLYNEFGHEVAAIRFINLH